MRARAPTNKHIYQLFAIKNIELILHLALKLLHSSLLLASSGMNFHASATKENVGNLTWATNFASAQAQFKYFL